MEPYQRTNVKEYSALLASSFAAVTGRELLATGPALAQRLFEAPFALVSHGTEADPIFRYANRAALALWKMVWEEFTAMPSRLSAEEMLQDERARLLQEAARKGYIDTYEGVRIAKDGQRFIIRNTVLWNVVDGRGQRHGQACVIHRWDYI